MRAADLARLNEPYPEALEPTEEDARAAIGIKLPHWASLESEIFADFVEQQPYGIGWWAPDPGTMRHAAHAGARGRGGRSLPEGATSLQA